MQLISTAFETNGKIPREYTCDGQNISPPLLISDVPSGTKSLALILEDPDVPLNLKADGLFVHWMAWDMPPDATDIPESSQLPGILGQNGAGHAEYTGPCPPDKEHRYFFKVYALDTMLGEHRIVTRDDLLKAMTGHIVGEAQLMGTYERSK